MVASELVESLSLNKRVDFDGVLTTEWGTVKAEAVLAIKKRIDTFIIAMSAVFSPKRLVMVPLQTVISVRTLALFGMNHRLLMTHKHDTHGMIELHFFGLAYQHAISDKEQMGCSAVSIP